LPEPIKQSLIENKISMGHARSILGAGSTEEQIEVWQLVLAKHLSVRETEKFINTIKKQLSEIKIKHVSPNKKFLKEMSALLSQRINSKIRIVQQGEKGKIEINFKTRKEFDHIIGLLKKIS
jgi:ParB family chromosome partitioning protein